MFRMVLVFLKNKFDDVGDDNECESQSLSYTVSLRSELELWENAIVA